MIAFWRALVAKISANLGNVRSTILSSPIVSRFSFIRDTMYLQVVRTIVRTYCNV